jgi:hypothetical protein
VIPFKGPDGIVEGWLDFGGGRFKVTAVDSGIFAPATGSTAYAPASGSTNYAPATGSPVYPAFKNPSGVYQLSPTAMWNRYDGTGTGTIVNGDSTAGGALEVYTQISTTGNDLALLVHGHADMHLANAAPSNRCQLLTITGAPTGGTFTLTYGGQTTSALAYNCTAAQIISALQALSSVSGAVYVYSGTGGTPVPGGPFTITMAQPNPTALTATASLTGGSSPGVTITQTTPDGALYFDMPVMNYRQRGDVIGDQGSGGSVVTRLGGAGNGAFYWKNLNGATILMELFSNGILSIGAGQTLKFAGDAGYPTMTGGGNVAPGLICYANTATGLSGKFRFRDNATDNNDRVHLDTAAPTSGATVLSLAYHNGTAVVFQNVTLGAADSGGTGFKALRVPN